MSEQSISQTDKSKPVKKARNKPRSNKGGNAQRLRSFPKLLVKLELRHHLTSTSFERNYHYYLQSFVSVTVALGRADVSRSTDVVKDFITGVITEARKDLEETKKLLAAHIEDAEGEVQQTITDVIRHDAEVPNNAAHQYIELYKAADEVVDHVYCAEILSKLDEDKKREILEHIRQILIRPTSCYSRLSAKVDKRLSSIDTKGSDAKDAMLELLVQIIDEDPSRNPV
ncbi:MAG: hypothetical protein GKR90_25345 [Pseudomonadales bacterium]|nr:hypothetical protein [Pseudomonadales bacterium]